MNKLSLIVSEQFPEFVQSEYPVFVEFIKAYYRWLETQQPVDYTDLIDIDNTASEFVKYFKRQLDVYGLMGDAIPFDTRYIKNIKEIYASKGSEEALIYLLRVIKKAETNIQYPSEQILRASDGRWKQEQFITIQTSFGTIPTNVIDFYITYEFSSQRVVVTKFEVLNSNTIRLYYDRTTNVAINVGTIIQIRNSDGIVEYAGRVVKSPSSISIKNGGSNWQLGQVIIIPGTVKNTVARVSQIDINGAILRAEIIDYGYNHTEFQSLTVSPYPVKPLGTAYTISSDLISISPLAYHHTLTLNDYTNGTSESTVGTMSGVFIESYFLEDYVTAEYNGENVLNVASTQQPEEESQFSDLTLEQWLASRATLVLNYSEKASLKGSWIDDRGQVSNEYIRLQDNLFYQQFSYIINSTENPSSYIELAKNIHPVGLKLFTNYDLETFIAVDVTADTQFPFIDIDLIDVTEITDDITGKHAIKSRSDEIQLDDNFYSSLDKYLTDSVGAISSDTYTIAQTSYNTTEYFAEEYAAIIKELTLGV